MYEIPQFLGTSYPLSFALSNIVSGFRVSGISPFNNDIFTDDECAPSSITDRPEPEATTGSGTVESPSDSDAEVGSNVSTIEPIWMSTTPQTPKGGQTMDPSSAVSPGDIRPFPKAGPRKARDGGRACGSCQVLTDTPEKKKIEEKAVGQIIK
ncbi:hypothetical protein QYM36_008504 [Artemia franciscana]|uniref:Uncharacterized protein n=2 Tax=Artemia franciscana TaxID=6661 RepID=A0AA88IIN1_ARTSF|nr:hypothetical protein QYM36_008504 [Artemia franciscana]